MRRLGGASESLLAALRAFEVTAARYDEHQRAMEHYWCLRWLRQEKLEETTATVIRENLVRFTRLPLTHRLADLPALPPETPVRVAIGPVDLLQTSLSCRYAGPVAA